MEECSYFVGNVLVQVRHVFLPDYPLILSLLGSKILETNVLEFHFVFVGKL